MAQVIPRKDAMEMAIQATQHVGVRVPRAHLQKLLNRRASNGKGLMYFYSVPVHGFRGRGTGFVIVDPHDDFQARMIAALKAEPYIKRQLDMTLMVDPEAPGFSEPKGD